MFLHKRDLTISDLKLTSLKNQLKAQNGKKRKTIVLKRFTSRPKEEEKKKAGQEEKNEVRVGHLQIAEREQELESKNIRSIVLVQDQSLDPSREKRIARIVTMISLVNKNALNTRKMKERIRKNQNVKQTLQVLNLIQVIQAAAIQAILVVVAVVIVSNLTS